MNLFRAVSVSFRQSDTTINGRNGYYRRQRMLGRIESRGGRGGGGGLLERPFMIEIESRNIKDEENMGANFQFEAFHRVILHYTNWSDNEEIARRLVRGVPVLSKTDGLRIASNAASAGTAIVITTTYQDASLYETRLTQMGLKVSLDLA